MMRRPEKTDTGRRTGNLLGVVIPGVMTPFDKAVVGGIAASVDRKWTLMTVGFGADAAVSGGAEGLARLCFAERVAGVFLRPISGKDGERKTAKILAQFRKAKIPVVLFGNAASKLSKRPDCDSVVCSVATSKIAARLGGIACHLMLQRLADSSVPPLEVLLD